MLAEDVATGPHWDPWSAECPAPRGEILTDHTQGCQPEHCKQQVSQLRLRQAGTLLSPESSDMVKHSLRKPESFGDPFPYLSESVA